MCRAAGLAWRRDAGPGMCGTAGTRRAGRLGTLTGRLDTDVAVVVVVVKPSAFPSAVVARIGGDKAR